MSEVAIIATRRFQFGAGLMRDGSFDRFVTTPNVTMMMPERFMNDPLFIKAHELGLLMVVSNVRTTPVASEAPSNVVNRTSSFKSNFLELKTISNLTVLVKRMSLLTCQ